MLAIVLTCLEGCAVGPVKIEHEHGYLPKVTVDTYIDNTKIKIKRDQIVLVFKKEY